MTRPAVAIVAIVAGLLATLSGCGRDEPATASAAPAAPPSAERIARGAYLARLGDCVACHTTRGGAPFAGGRGIATPFGTIHASNLTPDPDTGLGRWTADDFWRALHDGRSRDGRALYPAFPYPDYTRVTRADADALFDYLRSVPPVKQPNRPHALSFPYDQPWMLAAWRALYFRPAHFEPDPARTAGWNRGAYLVQGLGHCDSCHAERNALGAVRAGTELRGGTIAGQNWYAPSLHSPAEGGVAHWTPDTVVQLLATGTTPGATVTGPMAEVVFRSTQYWTPADLRATAEYLRSLPQDPAPPPRRTASAGIPPDDPVLARGRDLYGKHCADCHADDGAGKAGAYPPLAGNRAVTMPVATNVIRTVLSGGFAPATAGNPRPYGMPPFAHELNDADTAAVVGYIRRAWGNDAAPVTALAINRERGTVAP